MTLDFGFAQNNDVQGKIFHTEKKTHYSIRERERARVMYVFDPCSAWAFHLAKQTFSPFLVLVVAFSLLLFFRYERERSLIPLSLSPLLRHRLSFQSFKVKKNEFSLALQRSAPISLACSFSLGYHCRVSNAIIVFAFPVAFNTLFSLSRTRTHANRFDGLSTSSSVSRASVVAAPTPDASLSILDDVLVRTVVLQRSSRTSTEMVSTCDPKLRGTPTRTSPCFLQAHTSFSFL